MIEAILFLGIVIIATWRVPMLGLAMVANAFLVNSAIGGESTFVFVLVGAVAPLSCFGLLILKRYLRTGSLYTSLHADGWLVLGLFISLLLSSLFVNHIELALEISLRYLVLCASYYFVIRISLAGYNSEKLTEQYVKSILLVGVVVAVYAMFFGQSVSPWVVRLTIGDVSAIPLSILIGQSIVIAFYFLLIETNSRRFMALLGIIMVLCYVLVLNNTRSTIIGAILGITLVFIFTKGQLRPRRVFVYICLVGMAFMPLVFYFSANPELYSRGFHGFNRLLTLDLGESETIRLETWAGAWMAFSENFLIGTGTAEMRMRGVYSHNIFLELLADNGIIGFVLFFSLVVLILNRLRYKLPGIYAVVAALVVFQLFVAQVSMSLWMHKSLFIWTAFLLYKPNRSSGGLSRAIASPKVN